MCDLKCGICGWRCLVVKDGRWEGRGGEESQPGGGNDDSEVALPTIIHHQAIWVFMTADRAITHRIHTHTHATFIYTYITHQYSAKENEKQVNLIVENVLFNA